MVLLGDPAVGKTSLIERYTKNNFRKETEPTIGAHFVSKTIKLPYSQNEIKIKIWDTAGQEKYRSITPIYFRDADAAICVYDITSRSTLDSLENWIRDVRTSGP